MELSLNYEAAVYLAWTVPLALFMALVHWWPDRWQTLQPVALAHPRREALLALAAAFALVAISVATDRAFAPWKREPGIGRWVFLGQIVLCYVPIFAVMLLRRQGTETALLRWEKLPTKIALGALLSLVAALLFLLVRGQAQFFGDFLRTLGRGGPVAMLQTFMEGFGVGFVLYRVGAWLGIGRTSVLVAALFMAAHLPNYTSGNWQYSFATAAALAAAHAGIAVLVLVAAWRTQDIVVIGFLHWFINAASSFTAA